MAPSRDGRPGFSRRAQYSIFTGYVLAGLGILAALVLVVVSLLNPTAFSGLRGAAATVAAPVGQTGSATRNGIGGMVDTVAGYIRAGSKNAELERQLAIARTRLIEAQAIHAENVRLKALLEIDGGQAETVARARLIGATPSSSRRFALIDAGWDKGVRTGQPVRTDSGLVGRVLEVGPGASRVLLISDTASVVPVRRATDGIPAFAQGAGDGTLRIRLINLGPNPLRPGDVLVTSGSGGLFRPNTPVAMVVKLTHDGAIGRILSDPANTDFVIVQPAWASEVAVPPEREAGAAGRQP